MADPDYLLGKSNTLRVCIQGAVRGLAPRKFGLGSADCRQNIFWRCTALALDSVTVDPQSLKMLDEEFALPRLHGTRAKVDDAACPWRAITVRNVRRNKALRKGGPIRLSEPGTCRLVNLGVGLGLGLRGAAHSSRGCDPALAIRRRITGLYAATASVLMFLAPPLSPLKQGQRRGQRRGGPPSSGWPKRSCRRLDLFNQAQSGRGRRRGVLAGDQQAVLNDIRAPIRTARIDAALGL